MNKIKTFLLREFKFAQDCGVPLDLTLCIFNLAMFLTSLFFIPYTLYYIIVSNDVAMWAILFVFWTYYIFDSLREYKRLKALKYKKIDLCCNGGKRIYALNIVVDRWKFRKAIKTHDFEKIKMLPASGDFMLPNSKCKECDLHYGNGFIESKQDEIYMTCDERKFKNLLL